MACEEQDKRERAESEGRSPQLVFCESSKKRERAESGGLQSATRFLRVEQEAGCGVLLLNVKFIFGG